MNSSLSTDSTSELLKISQLHFRVDGLHILRGLDLQVKPGEMVGIIGPNGCGKTTLFNSISGFNRRIEGSIKFKGKDIGHLEPYERSRMGIGRVFQNFGIFREMTLVENLLTSLEAKDTIWQGLFPWSKRTKELKEVAFDLISQVKLSHLANKKAESLSGGQMRLLEIIRAVAFGADLFLLDEPTAGVSPRMKQEVAQQIISLKESGKTVLVIEHDINFIESFCERIVVLNEGTVVLDGTPEIIRSDQRLQEIYFGEKAAAT